MALPRVADLPPSFAIKASHTSGCNALVLNGTLRVHNLGACGGDSATGAPASDALLRRLCATWMAWRYKASKKEWAYTRIPELAAPSLLVEEVLRPPERAGAAADATASDMCCLYMPLQRGGGGGRSHQRMSRLQPRHALM